MARILMVDDDPDVVDSCAMVLEKEGYEVDSATCRAEGSAKARKPGVDLLILDVMMESPDDGIELARELRRDGIKAPILMMSSIGKVTGLDYGPDSEMLPVDDFVEKPLSPRQLLDKVAELLKGGAEKSEG